MKKLIIGGLVGGILIFLWQSLSWTVLDLHAKEYQKAGNQDSIMSYLNSQFTHDGQYFLPMGDRDASMEEHKKMMKEMEGKPWAILSYHKEYHDKMVTNVIRGLLVAIVSGLMICWLLLKIPNAGFGGTFIACVVIGLIGFFYIPYSNRIWFQTPGLMANLIDVLISYGLCGIWLGWWLNRKKVA